MPGTTSAWDIKRSTTASRYILETAEEHGLDAQTCLSGTGLTSNDLTNPAAEIRGSTELTIIRNVIRRLGDQPGLGMETGSRYTVADIGILGYALLSSPTVGDAINVARRYLPLTTTHRKLGAPEVNDAEAVVTFDDTAIPADVRRFLLERDFAILLKLLRPLIGGVIHAPTVLRLEVTDPQLPTSLLKIANNLNIMVENTGRNALMLPAHLVTQPMPAADPRTAAICIRQCEGLLNRRIARQGISAFIRMRIFQDSTQMPSMAAIAKELCVTERTLHRRLAAEGTSYRALLDEVRATLAAELLRSGLTVEETARRLGYSETAAFTRAHTRWNGAPPGRYRGNPDASAPMKAAVDE